ncbi:PLP-dependent transferase [Suillus decipiens]|nr:PLP-dependent transferase [Suillus decipiens]
MHKLFEFDPSYVNLTMCIHHWIEARTRVAKLIGADTDECVLVNNTLHGINTIIRNFEWHEGDIIIETTTTYNAVSRAISSLPHTDILENWREHIRQVTSEKSDLQQTRKVVAIVDAIAANPGVRLPWKEMVAICKDAGVWSIVDAAHSIGQEVDINLSEAKPDFWVSNCHKWLFAKRSCAVLYVPKRNHHVIKSPIPTPHTYHSPQDEHYDGPQKFVGAKLSLTLQEWLGGEYKINEYTHNLAIAGGKYLASLLGTSVNVELPIPSDIKYSNEINDLLRNTLLIEWNVYAVHYYHNGKWWTRCSVQIWNEISDFEVLANALKDTCQKAVKFAEK